MPIEYAPETIVRVLQNVPIENDYKNTLYFSSKTAQTTYFASKAKYSYTDFTYQRRQWRVTVPALADDILDCNYLMFQNSSFGDKWFYAFITDIEYLNPNATAITFEIDVMQTWLLDITFNQCFIEREHSETDEIGDNLVPENLELGEYTYTLAGSVLENPSDLTIIIATAYDQQGTIERGALYGGIYSGVIFLPFSTSQIDTEGGVNDILNALTTLNQASSIVSVFMIPTELLYVSGTGPRQTAVSFNKSVSQIDGYTPKNNKLFTYPYNFLGATNFEGASRSYRYEYFSGSSGACTFSYSNSMSPISEYLIWPTDYNGVVSNHMEQMRISGFPQCTYPIDSFKAYMAQVASNPTSIFTGAAGAAQSGYKAATGKGGTLAGGIATGLIDMGMNVVGTIGTILQNTLSPLGMPDTVYGTDSPSVMTALGYKDFYFYYVSVREEFARIIDDYFNMFGYATHRVKTPNISSRPHWNYVKTVGCTVSGGAPSNDESQICSIMDNGITFWKNPPEVGDYSLDNSPT